MKRLKRNCISIFIVMLLVVGLMPMSALANQADDIVSIASSQVGHVGGSTYGTGAWCAWFVSWCARQAGISTSFIPATGSCDSMFSGVINGGGKVVTSPQKGDLIFYKSYSGKLYDHVGIISSGTSSIQGNVGNMVQAMAPLSYYYDNNLTHRAVASDITYVRPLYKPNIPAIPTSVKAVSTSYNSIKISWVAVSGASNYELYRSTSSTGTYSLIGTTTSTNYSNSGLTTGTTYYYKLRAVATNAAGTVPGSYSGPISCMPIPAAPSNFTASRPYPGLTTTLSWSAVPGATGYELWRQVEGGSWALRSTQTTTGYKDTFQNITKYYGWKVRAYRTVGTSKVYSAWSANLYK